MPLPAAAPSALLYLGAELVVAVLASALALLFTVPAIIWGIVRGLLVRCAGAAAPPRQFHSVLITGASGGIGKGLALTFARPGVALTLVARRSDALEEVAKMCRERGAEVTAAVCSVTDEEQMRRVVLAADARSPLDLVIANAGVIADTEGFAGSRRVIDVNVQGALHTVIPAVPLLRERGRGQIVFMSSLGSFAPATNAYMMSYLASKAAINQFAGGMRAALGPAGVGVTVVTMGYVESEMTMGDLRGRGIDMPGLVSTADACERIKCGATANEPIVFFPFWLYLITRILGAMPAALRDMILPTLIANDPFTKVDRQYTSAVAKSG